MTPERQRLLDYCRRFGLRGENINAENWDEDGFEALNPITGEFHGPIPWPDGFNVDWFRKLHEVAAASDYRHAGLRVIH